MPQMQILAFENLRDVLQWMRTGIKPEAQELDLQNVTHDVDLDFADVAGQSKARFAAEVAATGGHHLLLVGPPGGQWQCKEESSYCGSTLGVT